MDCIICSLNIKFFSELSHLFLYFLLFGGHGWIISGFHPRTIMTMLFFGFWHFFKFFDCSCSQQELPPQWQKIQILRQYACCHGFVMAQDSKMRSKKSPYLFNICRRLDFGAIVGVVIAIISVIAVKCRLELIYTVFLILLGIIIYIIITHIGQSCLLTKK